MTPMRAILVGPRAVLDDQHSPVRQWGSAPRIPRCPALVSYRALSSPCCRVAHGRYATRADPRGMVSSLTVNGAFAGRAIEAWPLKARPGRLGPLGLAELMFLRSTPGRMGNLLIPSPHLAT